MRGPHAPETPAETFAAARGIEVHRERQAELAAVIVLEPFERELAAAAWRAGFEAAADAIGQAVGAGETIRCDVVRGVLERVRLDGLGLRVDQADDGTLYGWGRYHAAAIVGQAAAIVEGLER